MKQYSAEVQKGLKQAKKALLFSAIMPKLIINTPVKMSWKERALNWLLLLTPFIVFYSWGGADEKLEDLPIALRVIRVIFLIAFIFITFDLIKVVISKLSKQRIYVKRLFESCLPSSKKQIVGTLDLAMGRFTVDVFENEHPHWRLHCRQFVKLLRTPLKLKTEADVYMNDNGHPFCVIVDSDEHKLVFVVHQMEDLSESPQTKKTEQE